MSTTLHLKNFDFNKSDDQQIKLQYIPAEIGENTSAKVDEYFNVYTKQEDNILTNALRGRPLIGSDMKVPSHYQGIVFEETQRPLNENSARSFKVHDVFSEFTYWNYDKPPTENDALKQALTWHNFADLLHAPISAEQFDQEAIDAKSAENIKLEKD